MQDLVLSGLASTMATVLSLSGTDTSLFLPLLGSLLVVLLLDPLTVVHEQVVEFPCAVVHVLFVVINEDGAHDELVESPQEITAPWLLPSLPFSTGVRAA